jgi:hypothetical protein
MSETKSDPTNGEFRREAASIISDLLCSTLNCEQRDLYDWERRGLKWLADQWDTDPGTSINMWTADRVREFHRGDIVRCARPNPLINQV